MRTRRWGRRIVGASSILIEVASRVLYVRVRAGRIENPWPHSYRGSFVQLKGNFGALETDPWVVNLR